MPYISAEEVKTKRDELKKQFPASKGWKLKVQNHHHNSINVTVVEAPVDLRFSQSNTYEQVNQYWIDRDYRDNPVAGVLLTKIHQIIDKGNRTVCEDGDYGSIPRFYTNISLGSWDKPFKVSR